MEIAQEKRGRLPLLRLSGTFDLYAVPGFRMAMEPLVESGADDIALDLAGVTHLDSSAMGILIHFMSAMREQGRTILLTRVRPEHLRIFEVVRLDKIFLMVDGAEFDRNFPPESD